ncbi:ATP-grasp domain-containing protein [Methylovorus sp. MP688]|uniref:ATP-grasp domain-containing protein n=1 Tax=Methylovorus sp. (strain MP688) TaxID=887061 RepID=UPI00059CBE62|nr:ATP-grasp domain-containing protein [Methylovorus sp. MP688]
MKILVCEYITGGGLYRTPLPPSLAKEGTMMRDALLADLLALVDLQIVLTCDTRVPCPYAEVEVLWVNDDPWNIWEAAMQGVDAVWLIAPETEGILLRLTLMAEKLGKRVLGNPGSAIQIASSKSATLRLLSDAGLTVVPTLNKETLTAERFIPLVTKPDDGAGAEETYYFEDWPSYADWIKDHASHTIQAYVQGEAASLSMLCLHGRAWLLSCNRQDISLKQQGAYAGFAYAGSVLNGMAAYWQAFAELAQGVAQAMPDLAGYVGVDVIVTATGALHILEVNPRLTTSYVGLQAATGLNPARLIMDLFYNPDFSLPPINRHLVEVSTHV